MRMELLCHHNVVFYIENGTLTVTCGGNTFESYFKMITDKTEKELKKLVKSSTLESVKVNAREWGNFYVNTEFKFKVSPRMLSQVKLVLNALGLPSEFRCEGESYTLDPQDIVKKLKSDERCVLVCRDERIQSTYSSNDVIRGYSIR